MSVMFEVWYPPPPNPRREAALKDRIDTLGGRLDFREEPTQGDAGGICLTFEFDAWEPAERAADALRQQGEHVEGPMEYGD